MSTKIWEAYRLKKGYDLWTVLHDIRVKAERGARKKLTELYDALVVDFKKKENRLEVAKFIYTDQKFAQKVAREKDWGYMHAHDYILRKYREQRAKSERNPFDLDVALAIRHKDGRFYMIPYPGSGFLGATLRFLARHPALEDFHYQNQTDRPRHISGQAWAHRARVWNWLLEDERWDDKLVLDIVTADGFGRVDPWTHQVVTGWKKKRRKKRTEQQ